MRIDADEDRVLNTLLGELCRIDRFDRISARIDAVGRYPAFAFLWRQEANPQPIILGFENLDCVFCIRYRSVVALIRFGRAPESEAVLHFGHSNSPVGSLGRYGVTPLFSLLST